MSDLAKAFAGLKPQKEPKPKRALKLAPLPLDGTAKSRHPEYSPVKVFLRRTTHKAAGRKWEDEQDGAGNAGDFSDLVEQLLQKYLDA